MVICAATSSWYPVKVNDKLQIDELEYSWIPRQVVHGYGRNDRAYQLFDLQTCNNYNGPCFGLCAENYSEKE